MNISVQLQHCPLDNISHVTTNIIVRYPPPLFPDTATTYIKENPIRQTHNAPLLDLLKRPGGRRAP